MSTYQLGLIGTGNMGGALAQAAAKSGVDMLLSNRTAEKAERLAAELGCAAGTNQEIAEAFPRGMARRAFVGADAHTARWEVTNSP